MHILKINSEHNTVKVDTEPGATPERIVDVIVSDNEIIVYAFPLQSGRWSSYNPTAWDAGSGAVRVGKHPY